MAVRYIGYLKIESSFNIKLNNLKSVVANSISDFTYGFWINENLEFTRGSDSKYWIPPNAVIYVERIE